MSMRRKYSVKFPPGRVKKIVQQDEEVGKMNAAVPVMIGRTVELFAEQLLLAAEQVMQARQARTLTPQHVKKAVEQAQEPKFHCLNSLISAIQEHEPGSRKTSVTRKRSIGKSQSLEFSTIGATVVKLTKRKRGKKKQASLDDNLVQSDEDLSDGDFEVDMGNGLNNGFTSTDLPGCSTGTSSSKNDSQTKGCVKIE